MHNIFIFFYNGANIKRVFSPLAPGSLFLGRGLSFWQTRHLLFQCESTWIKLAGLLASNSLNKIYNIQTQFSIWESGQQIDCKLYFILIEFLAQSPQSSSWPLNFQYLELTMVAHLINAISCCNNYFLSSLMAPGHTFQLNPWAWDIYNSSSFKHASATGFTERSKKTLWKSVISKPDKVSWCAILVLKILF